MSRPDDMPIWVYLAFSSIETRRAALMLIYFCAALSLYCVPWTVFFVGKPWVGRVFVLHDWSWFVWMLPTTLWYCLSMLWMDRHSRWVDGV